MWPLAGSRPETKTLRIGALLGVTLGLAACGGSGNDIIRDGVHGGFVVEAETCRATHPSGMSFRQRGEALSFGVRTETALPLTLLLDGRILFTQPLAPLHGIASTGFSDARAFWRAFGQADQLRAGGVSVALGDQAGLRAALAACAYQDGDR